MSTVTFEEIRRVSWPARSPPKAPPRDQSPRRRHDIALPPETAAAISRFARGAGRRAARHEHLVRDATAYFDCNYLPAATQPIELTLGGPVPAWGGVRRGTTWQDWRSPALRRPRRRGACGSVARRARVAIASPAPAAAPLTRRLPILIHPVVTETVTPAVRLRAGVVSRRAHRSWRQRRTWRPACLSPSFSSLPTFLRGNDKPVSAGSAAHGSRHDIVESARALCFHWTAHRALAISSRCR